MSKPKVKNKISLQDQMDNILDYFDFEEVKETMEKLNWTWGENNLEAPITIVQLRQEARRHLNRVKDKNIGCFSSSGGFTAEKTAENVLELRFEIASLNGFDIFGEEVEFLSK